MIRDSLRSQTASVAEEVRSYEASCDNEHVRQAARGFRSELEHIINDTKPLTERFKKLLRKTLATASLLLTFLTPLQADMYREPTPITQEYVQEMPIPPTSLPLQPVFKEQPSLEKLLLPQEKTSVLMIHNVQEEESRYSISPTRLDNTLQWMFDNNYTLQTYGEYSRNGPGTRSTVLTFDDSTEDQFRYLPDGSLDPTCAVGILERFKTRNPDYTVTATFFINTTTQNNKTVFEQERLERRKLNFLMDNGYEIGAHGSTHADFNKLTVQDARENILVFNEHMNVWIPEYTITSFAWPYGSIPSEEIQDLIETFYPHTSHAWNGQSTGEERHTSRIEFGPDTVIPRYLPEFKGGNAYKPLPARTTHARSNPQLQTWQAHTDDEPDDRVRGQYHIDGEGEIVSRQESGLLDRQEGDLRRSTSNTREFWGCASLVRDGDAWSGNRPAGYVPVACNACPFYNMYLEQEHLDE